MKSYVAISFLCGLILLWQSLRLERLITLHDSHQHLCDNIDGRIDDDIASALPTSFAAILNNKNNNNSTRASTLTPGRSATDAATSGENEDSGVGLQKHQLQYDPQQGFVSVGGLHIPRQVVIDRAKSILWESLSPLIRTDRPVACINLHLQSNVGDSALMKAQLQLLHDVGVPQHNLVYNTTGPAGKYKGGKLDADDAKILKQISDEGGTVLFAAGGNMGTIYKVNQDLYNQVVKLAPRARIIHLPQSLVVEKSQKRNFNKTVGNVYRHHSDLHLFMRDVKSYQLAISLKLAPGRTFLVPDLAFYLGPLHPSLPSDYPLSQSNILSSNTHSNKNQIRPTVLWMKRADKEIAREDKGKKGKKSLTLYDPSLEHPDLDVVGPIDWRGSYCPKHGIFQEQANSHLQIFDQKELYYDAEVLRGSQLLSLGQAVLTDRLHGQILSYLLGVPLVVLPDLSFKGYNFFSTWTHVSSADTRYATNVTMAFNEVETILPETLRTMSSSFLSPSNSAKSPQSFLRSFATSKKRQMQTANVAPPTITYYTNISIVEPVNGELEKGVTLVILTVDKSRVPDLERTLKTAVVNPIVKRIIVVWNKPNQAKTMKSVEKRLLTSVPSDKLMIVVSEKNSLNNRYDPKLPILTEAVMTLDDDITITPDTISCLYESWQSDPDGLHSMGEGRETYPDKYRKGGFNPKTNFLLPRWIFHRKYLSVYFDDKYTSLRKYVDDQGAHCDDVAFSTVWTKHTNSPVTHVAAPFGKRRPWGGIEWKNLLKGEDKTLGNKIKAKGGLEGQAGRRALRQECTRDILARLDWTPPTIKYGTCSYVTQNRKLTE